MLYNGESNIEKNNFLSELILKNIIADDNAKQKISKKEKSR